MAPECQEIVVGKDLVDFYIYYRETSQFYSVCKTNGMCKTNIGSMAVNFLFFNSKVLNKKIIQFDYANGIISRVDQVIEKLK